MSKNKPIPLLTDEDKKRFWSKVNITQPNMCWILKNTTCRYGSISIKNIGYSSHRVSYVLHKRKQQPNFDIKQGYMILHKCGNSLCVNPSHLYEGTNLDNTKDRIRMQTHSNVEHFYLLDGKEYTLSELSNKVNLPNHILRKRILNCRWTIEKAIKTTVRKQSKHKLHNGHTLSYWFENRKYKYLSYGTIASRIHRYKHKYPPEFLITLDKRESVEKSFHKWKNS